MRGSSLKNTEYIYGVVVYSGIIVIIKLFIFFLNSNKFYIYIYIGHETKIMKNSFKIKEKKSSMQIQLTNMVIYIFII